jgi:hypothetical protein
VQPQKNNGKKEPDFRPSEPQPFPLSTALEAWFPLVMGGLCGAWILLQCTFGNGSGTSWASIVRLLAFAGPYLLIIVPITNKAIQLDFVKRRRMLPPSPLLRTASTFLLPATLAYVFAGLTGIFGLIVGLLVGLAVVAVAYWLMFRLEPDETASSYATVGGAFLAAAIVAAFVLGLTGMAVNKIMVANNATEGVKENPLGWEFAWTPPPITPAAPKADTSNAAGTVIATPATPSAAPNTPAPDSTAPPPVPGPSDATVSSSTTPGMPVIPPPNVSAPAAPSLDEMPAPPGSLFDSTGPTETDAFVSSIRDAKIPWIKVAYRPSDQGIYEQVLTPLTPSLYAGLIRNPGIEGKTIEGCKLAPVFRGLGAVPLGGEGGDDSSRNGRFALSPDGTLLLRLNNQAMPQLELVPFSGAGSKISLKTPDGFGKSANNGLPVAPELLGALPNHRFLIRWSTPERSALQVYPFTADDDQPPTTIRLGYTESANVHAVSPDGKTFAIIEIEADKPFVALYSLTGAGGAPTLLPVLTVHDNNIHECRGIAFSPDSSKVAVLLEQGTRAAVRSWNIGDQKRLAEAACTVPSANEFLGQVQGRTFDWLTNQHWLVHGQLVIDANTGSTVSTLTSELVSGQQIGDDRTFFLHYLGRDGHPHMAVVKYNPAAIK